MIEQYTFTGVWFVYDGGCPICNLAAHAMQLREALGPLNLFDARTETDHPLITEINARGLSLDDGMVIYHEHQFFHGKEALEFMAVFAAPKGFFNRINRLLFRSKRFASISYPWMRGSRNLLLFLRRKPKINNLECREQPIFQTIFGDGWEDLPPVMLKHYTNKPFSNDVYVTEGTMDVKTAPVLRMLAPLSRLFGGIPLTNKTDVPVTVRFESESGSKAFHFNRAFHFPGQKPYIFHSKMVPQGSNKVVEQMKFGLGWRVAFKWQQERVILAHDGYCLCLFGCFLPLPLNWLIGTVHAEEQAIDDKSFKMFVEINHWLFGKIYEYRGTFTMVTDHG